MEVPIVGIKKIAKWISSELGRRVGPKQVQGWRKHHDLKLYKVDDNGPWYMLPSTFHEWHKTRQEVFYR